MHSRRCLIPASSRRYSTLNLLTIDFAASAQRQIRSDNCVDNWRTLGHWTLDIGSFSALFAYQARQVSARVIVVFGDYFVAKSRLALPFRHA
ncbi:hypothetical protein ACLKA7_008678 [Drosophila subpalustris]